MTTCWLEIDWSRKLPGASEIARSRDLLRYERIALSGPGIEATLTELRRLFAEEFIVMASFRACDDDWVARWFAARNRLDEYGFFPHFLGSPTVRSVMSVPRQLPDDLGIAWPPGGAFTFDGDIAALLWAGGCYHKFEGRPIDAKRLGAAFAADLIGDRYDEFLLYRTRVAWSDFFYGFGDNTWILVDKATAQITLLCQTDTD
ncbi:hypothetical protein ACFVMC_30085 [Nocardia sp. NPDC127579]|uniref:hypothetical protein n=1 Tax=Nocardia sp. NPDC127579 TaxID=3345402 RepID=UPI0036260AB5